MNEQDYIGKKLSECPDGTVAVVRCNMGNIIVRMLHGEYAAYVKHEINKLNGDSCQCPTRCEVLHILKLGEPRPKTLADCPSFEAWKDPSGWVHFRVGELQCFYTSRCPQPFTVNVNGNLNYCKPVNKKIGPDWTRLGQITGLLIDGKPWFSEDGDE